MRKIAKYIALVATCAAVGVTGYKFGLGAGIGVIIGLAAFAIYAGIAHLEDVEELEVECFEDFMVDLESVINEIEHMDNAKKKAAIKGGESDAEDDA